MSGATDWFQIVQVGGWFLGGRSTVGGLMSPSRSLCRGASSQSVLCQCSHGVQRLVRHPVPGTLDATKKKRPTLIPKTAMRGTPLPPHSRSRLKLVLVVWVRSGVTNIRHLPWLGKRPPASRPPPSQVPVHIPASRDLSTPVFSCDF